MAQELTEQQQHLQNLVEQAQSLDASITQQRNLLLRCQGAIEYLQQTGKAVNSFWDVKRNNAFRWGPVTIRNQPSYAKITSETNKSTFTTCPF